MSVKNLVQVANDCAVSAESLEETRQEILSLYADILDLGKKVALSVYRIGEMLFLISYKMPKEDFDAFMLTLPFSHTTAENYVKLYCYFQGGESLSDLTVMQAYAMAGISGKKELAAPETAELIEGEEILDAIEADETETQAEIQKRLKAMFRLKPISGLALKKHRVCLEGSRFFVWTKSGKNRLVADLLIANDGSSSVVTLATNLQIEIEKYLATLEENGDVLV